MRDWIKLFSFTLLVIIFLSLIGAIEINPSSEIPEKKIVVTERPAWVFNYPPPYRYPNRLYQSDIIVSRPSRPYYRRHYRHHGRRHGRHHGSRKH